MHAHDILPQIHGTAPPPPPSPADEAVHIADAMKGSELRLRVLRDSLPAADANALGLREAVAAIGEAIMLTERVGARLRGWRE